MVYHCQTIYLLRVLLLVLVHVGVGRKSVGFIVLRVLISKSNRFLNTAELVLFLNCDNMTGKFVPWFNHTLTEKFLPSSSRHRFVANV